MNAYQHDEPKFQPGDKVYNTFPLSARLAVIKPGTYGEVIQAYQGESKTGTVYQVKFQISVGVMQVGGVLEEFLAAVSQGDEEDAKS